MADKDKKDKAPELPAPGASQSLAASKSNMMSRLQTLAGDILALAKRCDEASSAYFANGFDGAGANPIVQNDIDGENIHLTPALVAGVITAAQAITTATSSGTRDNLRKTQRTPGF